jgi:SnoaL-like protein
VVRRTIMANSGDVLRAFYAAVVKRELAAARRCLNEDLLFLGLFETYHNAEEYMAALTRLMQVVVRLDIKTIIAEGNDVAVFFELETKAPVAATTLVAEWHQIKNGRIARVESAFDGRPFAAMFGGGKRG